MRKRRRQKAQAIKPTTTIRPFTLPPSPFNLISPSQVEQIHNASLKILAKTGVLFKEDTAVSLFKKAGAKTTGQKVFLEWELIEHCLRLAPAQYTLRARNPLNDVTIGGGSCAVMPGGGPPFVRGLDGVRRPGTLLDVQNIAKLSQLSPDVQVMARKAVEAQDVPVALRHLESWRAILTLTDKPGQSGFVNGRSEAEDVLQLLAVVFGGEAAIDGTPVAHCSINVNSPLLYDTAMLEGLLAFARYGQPILITPFVMAGVTGPTTLAGTLAQHNAEVLAGLCLVQLLRPGTPVLYGTATSNVDLRNGNPAIGSPESAQSIAICAQLARHYNLPCRGGGSLTDSPIVDAQSNYERMFTLLTSVLSGVHFLMHGLGILESYLTLSYAQFVLDLDLLGMVRQLVRPFPINEDTLALETIDAIGPGGHFLAAPHTMQHFREAHFFPQVGLRLPVEQWEANGSQDATQRATERCRELLASYEQPEMETAVADALENFIEDRRRKLP